MISVNMNVEVWICVTKCCGYCVVGLVLHMFYIDRCGIGAKRDVRQWFEGVSIDGSEGAESPKTVTN